MKIRNINIESIKGYFDETSSFLKKYWLKLLLAVIVIYAVNTGTEFSLDLNDPYEIYEDEDIFEFQDSDNPDYIEEVEEKPKEYASVIPSDENLMNTYSNLPFTGDKVQVKDTEDKKLAKIKKQKAYVNRYYRVAISEMDRFGIPASITLAQGLLESNAGESKLAIENNNHFGLKCFSRSCKKGHCSNYTDDSHKDFFKIFDNAWLSYREHSLLLKRGSRYQKLFKLKHTDYKGWAEGLRKAGYATDPKYGVKLIKLIEELDLHKYDE